MRWLEGEDPAGIERRAADLPPVGDVVASQECLATGRPEAERRPSGEAIPMERVRVVRDADGPVA